MMIREVFGDKPGNQFEINGYQVLIKGVKVVLACTQLKTSDQSSTKVTTQGTGDQNENNGNAKNSGSVKNDANNPKQQEENVFYAELSVHADKYNVIKISRR